MYQMTICTLCTAEALEQYATVHWPRHLSSMPSFDVPVHGFWTDHEAGVHRSIALLPFDQGTDPAAFAAAYRPSPEPEADTQGFDINDIIAVEDLLLDPVAGSPLSWASRAAAKRPSALNMGPHILRCNSWSWRYIAEHMGERQHRTASRRRPPPRSTAPRSGWAGLWCSSGCGCRP
ncbi:hypothetical protein [Streptomyces sp. NPDC086838]|uniref:hypothetical protein n=1 Tax=Streptomyces sp. NPDC086838 TaxID=3365762 RepID=UPI003814D4BE